MILALLQVHLSFNLHKCGIYLRQTSLLQLINNSSYAAFAVKELKLLIQELCNYRIFNWAEIQCEKNEMTQ